MVDKQDTEINKEFSISGNRDVEQTRLAQDKEQERKLAQVRDQIEREQIRGMIAMRDEKLMQERGRARRELKAIEDKAVRDKVAQKEKLELTMKGVGGMTPRQQEAAVRQAVQAHHGAELDKHIDDLRSTLNEEIDKEITTALSKQERSRMKEHGPRRMEESEKRKAFREAAVDRSSGRGLGQKR